MTQQTTAEEPKKCVLSFLGETESLSLPEMWPEDRCFINNKHFSLGFKVTEARFWVIMVASQNTEISDTNKIVMTVVLAFVVFVVDVVACCFSFVVVDVACCCYGCN